MIVVTDRRLLARVRDRRARRAVALLEVPVCPGCGGDRENWTFGCQVCWWRFDKRRLAGRVDAAWFTEMSVRNREWGWQEAQAREAEGSGQPTQDSYYVLYPRHLTGVVGCGKLCV